MKKLFALLAVVSILTATQAKADEGMWLLPLLEKLNIKDMKRAGFKLTAEQIYSVNSTSLKDAVVIFGGGCTGEVISDQGLVLTNHHCGYGAIQQHSSVEHDYLKDGFWAKNKSEEIYTPGLNIIFLDRIEDVTAQIVPFVENVTSEQERRNRVRHLSDSISKNAVTNTRIYRASVTPMFGGNSFYLFVYKTYRDVRMVGAPPSSIGKFGADTDNWMWPRHTGDFSLFRIYADANGNPAEYSTSNVPLKPKYHLPISLKGFDEKDFAMVMGFPGSTQRYMTSWEVAERIAIDNANRIKIRGIRQDLMMEDMQADPKVKIQYASKYSQSSNYWKNSIGMNKALTRLKIIDQKRAQETAFTNWLATRPDVKAKCGDALELIESAVRNRAVSRNASQYLNETVRRSSEVVGFARMFASMYENMKRNENDTAAVSRIKGLLQEYTDGFFKNYNMPTDRKVSAAMFHLYVEDVPKEHQAAIFSELSAEYHCDWQKYASYLYDNTIFADEAKVKAFLENPSAEKLETDPALKLSRSIEEKANELGKATYLDDLSVTEGYRKYVAGLEQMYRGVKPMYPDANFTMRLTYGTVSGYVPADASQFGYVTTLKGVLEKEDPTNWEFEVPDKLKQLYASKDFGQYAMKDGRMPVNFIFNGDITGGNSGSPVLNGRGELIGTAFDGNWEAMSGDIAFEPEMQRCINVDIRYTLFIIDKFAGASYLLDEMTIRK